MLPLAKRIAFIALSITLVGTAMAQMPAVAQLGAPPVVRTREADRERAKAEQANLKRINAERQAAIKKDTDKLLQLATELKQYVDKTNENTLSLDVVKKAGEIEKLAKDVKEKMKTGY